EQRWLKYLLFRALKCSCMGTTKIPQRIAQKSNNHQKAYMDSAVEQFPRALHPRHPIDNALAKSIPRYKNQSCGFVDKIEIVTVDELDNTNTCLISGSNPLPLKELSR